jgi:beta-glucosidase
VTFYKSVNDLPSFKDYNLTKQTYRFFKGEPLYPFGYGLSYTTFGYENLKVDENQKRGEPVKISVTVKNTGKVKGDEVVQVYVSHLNATTKVPLRSLAQFERVTLAPGESKQVDLTLAPASFLNVNGKGEKDLTTSDFEIAVGGGQPGVKVGSVEVPGLKAKIALR